MTLHLSDGQNALTSVTESGFAIPTWDTYFTFSADAGEAIARLAATATAAAAARRLIFIPLMAGNLHPLAYRCPSNEMTCWMPDGRFV